MTPNDTMLLATVVTVVAVLCSSDRWVVIAALALLAFVMGLTSV